jgi:hypothetical protein
MEQFSSLVGIRSKQTQLDSVHDEFVEFFKVI